MYMYICIYVYVCILRIRIMIYHNTCIKMHNTYINMA